MNQQYFESSDVYSSGVIMTELLTYNIPYSHLHLDPHNVIVSIVNKGLSPLLPNWEGHELSGIFYLI